MDIAKSLPAVIVRGTTPLPHTDFRIEVGRKLSLKAVEESEKGFAQYVVILIQKNPMIEEPTVQDLETHGVLAKIAMKIKLPNDSYKVKFNVLKRIRANEFFLTKPYFVVDYEEIETTMSVPDEELTLVKMVVNEIANNDQTILQPSNNVMQKIQQGITIEISLSR